MTRVLALAAAILALGASFAQAAAIVDLSQRNISITTGFAGGDVLLFGAVEEPADIVVVVEGPAERQTVRRKARVAGIWLNRDAETFVAAPTFYHVASSRPLADIPEAIRHRYRMGVDQLSLASEQPLSAERRAEFVAAFVRLKQAERLYNAAPGKVEFLGHRLFRTPLALPDNVPTGRYRIEVFELRGETVTQTSLDLQIEKTGFEARVFDFAQSQGLAYGLFAVVFALMAGWAASAVFRW
ncbi:MAG: hypothetical protein EXQ88_04705 [Alphaproteobacteria bacterium]|nr:hypothetical protein [Alphaproteobacteria bacterium]